MAVGGKERVRGVARGLAHQKKEVETMPWKADADGDMTSMTKKGKEREEGDFAPTVEECNDDCAFTVV